MSACLLFESPFDQSADPDIAVVTSGNPGAMVRKAVDLLGGMPRFVRPGEIVIVKPNISWDRSPEQGATTHPEAVAEVVRLCLESGAKKVKVFDHTLNEARRCYARSGIEEAAKKAGAEVFFVYEKKFRMTDFPDGELIKSWEVYKDVLEADRIINVPAAKHHTIAAAKVSLGLKNLMGFLGGNRGLFHRQFEIKITDVATKIRPDLTILDAYRVLVRNGPSGGSLADVTLAKTVVAGTDPVAVDSYGATLFGLNPEQIAFLQNAHERGLGECRLNRIRKKIIALQ